MTTSARIRDLFDLSWVEFQQAGVYPSAPKLMSAARQKYKDNPKLKYLNFPKIRWAQKYIQELSKLEDTLDPKVKEEDKPWCIGVSAKYGIPDEANADLLKMRRLCLLVDKDLSIRQAKWVARLRGVVLVGSLYFEAIMYAARERAFLLHNKDVITTDLDALIMFPNWSVDIADEHEVISFDRSMVSSDDVEAREMERGEARSAFWPRVFFPLICTTIEYFVGLSLTSTSTIVSDWNGMDTELETEEEQIVYALWLKRFSEGECWQEWNEFGTNEGQMEYVATTLAKEVIEFYWKEPGLLVLGGWEKFKPSDDLLEFAGLQLSTDKGKRRG